MSQVTVTLPAGPALTATSLVITDVASINFDVARSVLTVFKLNGSYKEFDFAGAATVTYTVSAGVSTVVVS